MTTPPPLIASYGAAAWLIATAPFFSLSSQFEVSQLITNAVRLRQLYFRVSADGVPSGLMIWAWLDPDVRQRMLADGIWPPRLHPSEWREGTEAFFICAIVRGEQSLRALLAECDDTELGSANTYSWIDWTEGKRRIYSRPNRSRTLAHSKRISNSGIRTDEPNTVTSVDSPR